MGTVKNTKSSCLILFVVIPNFLRRRIWLSSTYLEVKVNSRQLISVCWSICLCFFSVRCLILAVSHNLIVKYSGRQRVLHIIHSVKTKSNAESFRSSTHPKPEIRKWSIKLWVLGAEWQKRIRPGLHDTSCFDISNPTVVTIIDD